MNQDFDYYSSQHDEEEPAQLKFEENSPLLTKDQENKMLYSIQIKAHSENLLDLSFEEGVSGEAGDGSLNPRHWQFVRDRLAEISSPITISDGYITSYKLYRVRTRKIDCADFDTVVERRYNDFEYLHEQLIQEYGGWLVPRLPDKNIWANLDLETEHCRQLRQSGLQKYLNRLLRHEKLRFTDQLRLFLFDTEKAFSRNKGEYSCHQNYQQALKKVSSGVYEVGVGLFGKYIGTEVPRARHIPVSKEDNEILHFEFIVKSLNTTMSQLHLIVQNTSKEVLLIRDLGSVCHSLSSEDCCFSSPTLDVEKITEEYEEILEIIECCKEALARRTALRSTLEELRNEEEAYLSRNKHNPRSMSLDMIRAQIQSTGRKYQKWSKQLLVELQKQILMGKSMVKKFVGRLQKAREHLYCLPH